MNLGRGKVLFVFWYLFNSKSQSCISGPRLKKVSVERPCGVFSLLLHLSARMRTWHHGALYLVIPNQGQWKDSDRRGGKRFCLTPRPNSYKKSQKAKTLQELQMLFSVTLCNSRSLWLSWSAVHNVVKRLPQGFAGSSEMDCKISC